MTAPRVASRAASEPAPAAQGERAGEVRVPLRDFDPRRLPRKRRVCKGDHHAGQPKRAGEGWACSGCGAALTLDPMWRVNAYWNNYLRRVAPHDARPNRRRALEPRGRYAGRCERCGKRAMPKCVRDGIHIAKTGARSRRLFSLTSACGGRILPLAPSQNPQEASA